MRIFAFLFLTIQFAWAQGTKSQVSNFSDFINHEELKITNADYRLAERIINVKKLVYKGYINNEILGKLLKDLKKNPVFHPFLEWLTHIEKINSFKNSSDFIGFCSRFTNVSETKSLEKHLENSAGRYCRIKALDYISRDIEKTKLLSDDSATFINNNLKYYLKKSNIKAFAFFIQNHSDNIEVLKRVSFEITNYSIHNSLVPSQELLKDMLINEQLTRLIQDRGFNLIKPQNFFYAEYGKLIEQGYKLLAKEPSEKAVKEHYQQMKNFLELNADHLPESLCYSRLNDLTKSIFRAKFPALARTMYEFILKKGPKDIFDDALFYYAWTYITTDEYKEVLKLIDKYKLLKNPTQIADPRLKYWIAYAHNEVHKDKEFSSKIYENIVENHPLNFYAILSTKQLSVLKPDSVWKNFYQDSMAKDEKPLIQHSELTLDYKQSLIRLKAWAKLDNQLLMNLELKRIRKFSIPQIENKTSDLHIVNAQIMMESKNYLSSFRYLYIQIEAKEVQFGKPLLNILYPRPYLKDLEKSLKPYSIDPLVVLSLIRQESVFNPAARSPVGARGLMQLMPATARRMKRSVGERQLNNPATNLEVGTKYFNLLMKRYDNNLVYSLAAYNAGEGRVDRWKNNLFNDDWMFTKNVETIPFLETRNYVKLISRNIFFYKLLQNKKELTDSSELNKIFDVNLGFKR